MYSEVIYIIYLKRWGWLKNGRREKINKGDKIYDI